MLKELNISYTNITDVSLIAIAKNYTGLQLLDTCECDKLLCSDKLLFYWREMTDQCDGFGRNQCDYGSYSALPLTCLSALHNTNHRFMHIYTYT